MKASQRSHLLAIGAGALLGLSLDFLFSGVLKVIWVLVYAPFYVAVGNGIYMRLRTGSFKESAIRITVAFFFAAILGHLVFTGYKRKFDYTMKIESLNPTTLVSSDWPQKLILVSDRVFATLVKIPTKSDTNVANLISVPITIEETMDYGCVRSSRIVSVAGVDISNEAASSWTWKTDHSLALPLDGVRFSGPGNEDQNLPWCLIHFYRSAL